jgi:hypothetical protein
MSEPKKRKPKKSAAATLKSEQEAAWRQKLVKSDKAPKAYGMDKVFVLDDRVEHQVFGMGLVVSLVPPNKVNVFFEDGLKLMKCG